LIRWRGYDEANDTWEPEENLKNAPQTLLDYKTSHDIRNIVTDARGGVQILQCSSDCHRLGYLSVNSLVSVSQVTSIGGLGSVKLHETPGGLISAALLHEASGGFIKWRRYTKRPAGI
jgi:hypothetical protein